MLAYFAYGQRHYYQEPIPYMVRRFWEFQAVVQGRIAQTEHGKRPVDVTPEAATLWISPPGADHGWTGDPDASARIVVFHFHEIPETLQVRLSETLPTRISLTQDECRQLCHLADQVSRYWQHSPPGAQLCYEQARQTLSLLSFEALNRLRPSPEKARGEARVQQALRWYHERLADNPTLQQIARTVHCSPAHLRRLFQQSYQAPPKALFDQLRYQKALQLLTETTWTMAAIAEACGFQDQSAFSRAFKNHFGCSPGEMRSPRKRVP